MAGNNTMTGNSTTGPANGQHNRLIATLYLSLIALVIVVGARVAIQVADRFSGNGTTSMFYAVEIDVTCVSHREHGDTALVCFEGDRREVLQ